MTAATEPRPIEISMIVGTRRPRRLAAAGGATRKANTSRFPTDSNDDTIAIGDEGEQRRVGEPRAQPEQAGPASRRTSSRGTLGRSTITPPTAIAAAIACRVMSSRRRRPRPIRTGTG